MGTKRNYGPSEDTAQPSSHQHRRAPLTAMLRRRRFKYSEKSSPTRRSSAGAIPIFSSSSSSEEDGRGSHRSGRRGPSLGQSRASRASAVSGGAGSETESETSSETESEDDWVTPQEWRSWRAPREQRWAPVESHSHGVVLGSGVGRPSAAAGGGLSPRGRGAAAAVLASSTRHLSKGAKAALSLDFSS